MRGCHTAMHKVLHRCYPENWR